MSVVIYFESKDLQYTYAPDSNFKGVWYKDSMYDSKGKKILTRVDLNNKQNERILKNIRSKRCIEIVIRSKNIENYRIKKVYKPEIIKLMCSSKYYWWNDTDYDKKQIMEFLKYWNPKEVEKL